LEGAEFREPGVVSPICVIHRLLRSLQDPDPLHGEVVAPEPHAVRQDSRIRRLKGAIEKPILAKAKFNIFFRGFYFKSSFCLLIENTIVEEY
jgi:hypothetical protein